MREYLKPVSFIFCHDYLVVTASKSSMMISWVLEEVLMLTLNTRKVYSIYLIFEF